MNFCPHFRHLLSGCSEIWHWDLHLMLLSVWRLRANRHREGRTFVMGLNEVTFTCVPEKHVTF
jgi:hypothetical protein